MTQVHYDVTLDLWLFVVQIYMTNSLRQKSSSGKKICMVSVQLFLYHASILNGPQVLSFTSLFFAFHKRKLQRLACFLGVMAEFLS